MIGILNSDILIIIGCLLIIIIHCLLIIIIHCRRGKQNSCFSLLSYSKTQ